MKKITILLVDDHAMLMEGFSRMLARENDLVVVGEARDGREAVTLATQLCPDVVLMDIAMPRLNGLEATRQVLRAVPTTKVLIVSAHSDEAYVQNAAESGAVGFILKQASARDVCQAIREVQNGGRWFNPVISRDLSAFASKSRKSSRESGKMLALLTSREMEVLQLIAEGHSNKEVAAELGIRPRTVEIHRGHLMAKLGIHNTAGLTRYAISMGVIESSVQVTVIPDPMRASLNG